MGIVLMWREPLTKDSSSFIDLGVRGRERRTVSGKILGIKSEWRGSSGVLPVYKKMSAEASKKDLCPRPQIKKSRNEGAEDQNANM